MEGFTGPVYSKNTIEFVTVANEFTKFIEASEQISLTDFVDTAHRLLPLLYLKGTLLPADIEAFEEFNEKFVTQEDYNYVQRILLAKFGEHNFYDEVFDPLRQENDEPVQLSIAESMADIYQDIKDFIMLYQMESDEIRMNAIWECRQTFGQYWGQRIVNVLRVLHHLKYTVVELEEEEIQSDTDSSKDYGNIDTSNWLISRMQDDFNNEE
jgi:hypothetical protein